MNRITAQDVRMSIEYYKSLKGTDWSSFNAEILLHQKPIYNFIHDNDDKLYTRNELACIEYCTYIAYHAIKVSYGNCPYILKDDALEKLKKQYNRKEVLDTDRGPEMVLEHHLKILIHGDCTVRQKSVLNIISTVCAFIELYVSVMVESNFHIFLIKTYPVYRIFNKKTSSKSYTISENLSEFSKEYKNYEFEG